MTILSDVKALGQQIWLDNLSRSLVQSGELAEMLKQGVCGVTSNPAIFQKAFAGDALYADEVAALKQQDLTPKQRYETMAVADVQAACDVCLAEHESTGGKTGLMFPISTLSPASLFPVSMPRWTPPCPTTSEAKSPSRWPKPPIKIGRNTSAAANLPHLPKKVPTAYNFCGHPPV